MLTYDTPAYMFNAYKKQPSWQTGSRNVTGPKTLPTYGVPIWSLWPNIRFLPSIVAEKNVMKKYLGTDRGKTVYPSPPPAVIPKHKKNMTCFLSTERFSKECLNSKW